MTAIVGTLISTSGKEVRSICSARRSLMYTNPLALPPIEPEPICVQRKVPSQKLRSKTGNSATRGFRALIDTSHRILTDELTRRDVPEWRPSRLRLRWPSYPAAFVARLRYATNGDSIGSISHIQLL